MLKILFAVSEKGNFTNNLLIVQKVHLTKFFRFRIF